LTQVNGRALVLAMGNDILSDDGVGLHAARLLRWVLPENVDIIETGEAGFALLELMTGYRRVLILDAIQTRKHPPGTLLHYTRENFTAILSPSPHYAGLPDLEVLAKRTGIDFPARILILAMEVEDMRHIGEELSPSVAKSLHAYVREAHTILEEWNASSDFGEKRAG
jgi:hydrogenase maturation protease